MFACPIQIGNRSSSLRTAVPGRRERTAHAGTLTMPGAPRRTKPGAQAIVAAYPHHCDVVSLLNAVHHIHPPAENSATDRLTNL